MVYNLYITYTLFSASSSISFNTSSSFLPIVIRTFCCCIEEAEEDAPVAVIRLSSSTIAVVSMCHRDEEEYGWIFWTE